MASKPSSRRSSTSTAASSSSSSAHWVKKEIYSGKLTVGVGVGPGAGGDGTVGSVTVSSYVQPSLLNTQSGSEASSSSSTSSLALHSSSSSSAISSVSLATKSVCDVSIEPEIDEIRYRMEKGFRGRGRKRPWRTNGKHRTGDIVAGTSSSPEQLKSSEADNSSRPISAQKTSNTSSNGNAQNRRRRNRRKAKAAENPSMRDGQSSDIPSAHLSPHYSAQHHQHQHNHRANQSPQRLSLPPAHPHPHHHLNHDVELTSPARGLSDSSNVAVAPPSPSQATVAGAASPHLHGHAHARKHRPKQRMADETEEESAANFSGSLNSSSSPLSALTRSGSGAANGPNIDISFENDPIALREEIYRLREIVALMQSRQISDSSGQVSLAPSIVQPLIPMNVMHSMSPSREDSLSTSVASSLSTSQMRTHEQKSDSTTSESNLAPSLPSLIPTTIASMKDFVISSSASLSFPLSSSIASLFASAASAATASAANSSSSVSEDAKIDSSSSPPTPPLHALVAEFIRPLSIQLPASNDFFAAENSDPSSASEDEEDLAIQREEKRIMREERRKSKKADDDDEEEEEEEEDGDEQGDVAENDDDDGVDSKNDNGEPENKKDEEGGAVDGEDDESDEEKLDDIRRKIGKQISADTQSAKKGKAQENAADADETEDIAAEDIDKDEDEDSEVHVHDEMKKTVDGDDAELVIHTAPDIENESSPTSTPSAVKIENATLDVKASKAAKKQKEEVNIDIHQDSENDEEQAEAMKSEDEEDEVHIKQFFKTHSSSASSPSFGSSSSSAPTFSINDSFTHLQVHGEINETKKNTKRLDEEESIASSRRSESEERTADDSFNHTQQPAANNDTEKDEKDEKYEKDEEDEEEDEEGDGDVDQEDDDGSRLADELFEKHAAPPAENVAVDLNGINERMHANGWMDKDAKSSFEELAVKGKQQKAGKVLVRLQNKSRNETDSGADSEDEEENEDAEEEGEEEAEDNEEDGATESEEEDEDVDVAEEDGEEDEDGDSSADESVDSSVSGSSWRDSFPFEKNLFLLSRSFQFIRRIYTCADAVTFQAISKLSGNVVCLKICTGYSTKRVPKEVRLLTRAQGSERICGFEGWTPLLPETHSYAIVLKWLENHSIEKNIFKNDLKIRVYMQHLLEALAHLHERGILYRDTKPSNMLWNDAQMQGTLIDFDVSTFYNPKRLHRSMVGTDGYRGCPEILEIEKSKRKLLPKSQWKMSGYGLPVDSYAAGVVFAQLIFDISEDDIADLDKVSLKGDAFVRRIVQQNRHSAATEFVQQTLRSPALESIAAPYEDLDKWGKLYSNEISEGMSPAYDLLLKLLEEDPKKRLTVSDALKHPFFHLSVTDAYRNKYQQIFAANAVHAS